MPITKLAQLKLSDLAEGKQNIKAIEDLKIGHIGALTHLALNAKLGGITIGQFIKLNVTKKLSYTQFGPIGEIQLKHIVSHAINGKLGILAKINMQQLVALAKTELLTRLSTSLSSFVIPMDDHLKKQVNQVIHYVQAKPKTKATLAYKREKNLPQYAFQLPQVHSLYNFITFNKLLTQAFLTLINEPKKRKEVIKEDFLTKKLIKNPLFLRTDKFTSNIAKKLEVKEAKKAKKQESSEIKRATNELQKNAEEKMENILEILKNYGETLYCEQLNDCDDDLISNVARVLLSLNDRILIALNVKKLLLILNHIEIWNLNRLLAGLLGGINSIIGSSLEATLNSIIKPLGGSLHQLKGNSSISLSNDRCLHFITLILGKPFYNKCSQESNTTVSDHQETDQKADEGEEETTSRKVFQGMDRAADQKEDQEEHHKTAKIRSQSVPQETTKRAGKPQNRNKRDIKEEHGGPLMLISSEDEALRGLEESEEHTKPSCEVIKDVQHFNNIANGEEPGSLSNEIHMAISSILVSQIRASLKNLSLEFNQLDRTEKWKTSHLLMGFISGVIKQFDYKLGQNLFHTADCIISGLDTLLPSSSSNLAIGISGALDSTLISVGYLVPELESNLQGKQVLESIKPLSLLLNVDSFSNTVSAPVYDSINLLINSIPTLSINLVKKLLNSLSKNVKELFTQPLNTTLSLSSIDMKNMVKIYSSTLYILSNVTHSSDQKAKSIILAINNCLQNGHLDLIANTLVLAGSPLNKSVDNIICGQVSHHLISFDSLKKNLGSISSIFIPTKVTEYSEGNRWKGRKIEGFSGKELVVIFSSLSNRLDIICDKIIDTILNDNLDNMQVMTMTQSLIGYLIGIVISISHHFMEKGGLPVGIKLLNKVEKIVLNVNQEFDFKRNPILNSDSAQANMNVGSCVVASLSVTCGIPVSKLANAFYDFGYTPENTSRHQITPGTIGAIFGGVGIDFINAEHQILSKVAKMVPHGIKSMLGKNGIIVVTTDSEPAHFSQFYDEEDIQADTKEMIMDQIQKILLQKQIQSELDHVYKGINFEPITLEVSIPYEGMMKKFNVTLSLMAPQQSVEEDSKVKTIYSGPPLDVHQKTRTNYSSDRYESCLHWREIASSKLSSFPGVFIPTCLKDGSFSPSQCDHRSHLCWCVDGKGRQIHGTMTKFMRPNCRHLTKQKGGKSINGNTIEDEIDLGSKYLIGSTLEENEKPQPDETTAHESDCLREQKYRKLLSQRKISSAIGIFIPECNEDGTYAQLQCDKRTNFCWCVTKYGKEIPNTAKIGGDPPKNCKKMQEKYLSPKDRTWFQLISWNYLWSITNKWRNMAHNKVAIERQTNPHYRYKPNGILVRLPKSSGYENSLMFCAKDAAGPGLPSPYEVWTKIMISENPNFNKSEYEVAPKEFNKLAFIRLPTGSTTIQVPLATIIEAFPAAQDLYLKVNGDIDKLETILQNVNVDWKALLTTANRKDSLESNVDAIPEVIGDGHMKMISPQRMCFCHGNPNAGTIINVGVFGSGPQNPLSMAKNFTIASEMSSRSGTHQDVMVKTGTGDGDEESTYEPSGQQYSQFNNDELKNYSGPTASLLMTVNKFIRQINPFKFITMIDMSELLKFPTVHLDKLEVPLSFFMPQFFDKISAGTGLSKSQISEELGTKNLNDKEAYVSIGAIIRLGAKSHLKLGMLLSFFGFELDPYMSMYENYMLQMLKTPLDAANKYINQKYEDVILKVKQFVNESGGGLNSAVVAVNVAIDSDAGKKTKEAINAASEKFAQVPKALNKAYNKTKIYIVDTRSQIKANIKEWVGPNSLYTKIVNFIKNGYNEIYSTVMDLPSMNWYYKGLHQIASLFGKPGKALLDIVYIPISTLLRESFGSLLLIPKILLFEEGDIFSRVLSIFPFLIQFTGDVLKPGLMVINPFIRLTRFLLTGEFEESINAGSKINEKYGLSIWEKSDSETPSTPSPDFIPAFSKDQILASSYRGAPPPGGFKLGATTIDMNLPLNSSIIMSRILLIPDFLLKAGGRIFSPVATILTPILKASNELIFGTSDVLTRIMGLPPLFRSVGIFSTYADILLSLNPLLKTLRAVIRGEISLIDATFMLPSLMNDLSGGVLQDVVKSPNLLIDPIVKFTKGHGGLLSMIKLQMDSNHTSQHSNGDTDMMLNYGFINNSMEGGKLIGSFGGTLFNGIIGNIIDPIKLMASDIKLSRQPLKSFLKYFSNARKMFNISIDKNSFLTATLGGQDPEALLAVGLNMGKLIQTGVDCAYFLTSGIRLLKPEYRQLFNNRSKENLHKLGIDEKLMGKIDLDVDRLLKYGLTDIKEEKLIKAKIDINLLINRIMRNSIEDRYKLVMAGINIKSMLKAGIDVPWFFSAGINSIDDSVLKNINFNKKLLTDKKNMKKIGLNIYKLTAKGIDPIRFTTEGIDAYPKEMLLSVIGMNAQKLENSMNVGLNTDKVLKSGIDSKKMVKSGVSPTHLLNGGLRDVIKDVSKQSLNSMGIDINKITAKGINSNIILDVGIAVLNPISLAKIGFEAHRAFISQLSEHGLDVLTGGIEYTTNIIVSIGSTLISLVSQMENVLKLLRQIPIIGPLIISKEGTLTSVPNAFFDIMGIDKRKGLKGFINKVANRDFETHQVLKSLNPLRIIKVIKQIRKQIKSNINEDFTPKEVRKPVIDIELNDEDSFQSFDDSNGISPQDGLPPDDDDEHLVTTTKNPRRKKGRNKKRSEIIKDFAKGIFGL